jgi:hypothetical protein
MALSIDQIRNYSRGGSLAIADAGGAAPAQIEKTGFVHWIKLRFGNVRAVEKNQNTLDAIRAAIQNDPRYFDDEVQNRAAQLLADVSTGSTIGAAKIKGIIAQLDQMSTPVEQRKSIMRLATGHLLALGMPEGAAGMEKAYKNAAVKFTAKLHHGESYADINVVGRLQEFNAIMGRLFDRLGDDPAARSLFAACVDKGRLFTGNSELRGEAELEALVDGIKATVEGLDEIGAKHGEAARANALAGLQEIGAPLPPRIFQGFIDGAANMPKCGLDKLNANSSAAEIHGAIAKFVKSIETKLHTEPFETNDPLAAIWLQRFIGMGVVASLSKEEKQALLSAFKSEQGGNLLSFYTANTAASGPFQALFVSVMNGMQIQLKADVDHAPPNTQVEMPAEYNVAMLPANAIFDIEPELAVSGAGAKKLMDKLVQGSTVQGLDDPMLKTRINAIAKNALTVNFAEQFNVIRKSQGKAKTGKPDFDLMCDIFRQDLFRGFAMAVTINGKTVTLPREDPGKARDILTQFLLQDEKAVFTQQDGDVKAKVYMLMSGLHQGVVAAIQGGVSKAFSPAAKNNPIYAGGAPTIAFALSLNENRDVEIDLSARLSKGQGRNPFMLTSQPTDDPAVAFTCSQNGYFDYSAKITMPAAAMDTFIKADWENYDHTQVKPTAMNNNLPNNMGMAVALIPEQFRCECEVEVAFHLHAENVTKMNEEIVRLK